jgi:hypothetical protein
MYGHSPSHEDLISSRLMKIAANGRQMIPSANSIGHISNQNAAKSGITTIPKGKRIIVMRKSIANLD